MWVERPSRIALHYLSGWFFLDFVSIAVSGVDLYGVTLGSATMDTPDNGSASSDGGGLTGLRALRALRALRLIKARHTRGLKPAD